MELILKILFGNLGDLTPHFLLAVESVSVDRHLQESGRLKNLRCFWYS